MELFWLGLGAILMAFAHAFREDYRNARLVRALDADPPRAKQVEIPVATVLIRADRDVAADISRALNRSSHRWN